MKTLKRPPDLSWATRSDLEQMIRRRRNLGAFVTTAGALTLFAMIFLFVPATSRSPEPVTAARTLPR